ncbi:DEAD/DEAH box helicase [Agromyces mariniharenae]|uniref:DEAD/DEAH box helicase n=1 Tax=Agromyces mariniharenae TaxID=2604423 RepID=A0A5S4V4W4_9MICO|nr:DEAD/DEAH box helicase [Agromyces mariniharenae]TYL54032.1 DEAD/DEAH box helicase [Agromyces mariniharenae]
MSTSTSDWGGPSDQLSAAIEYHIVNALGWTQLRPLQQAAIAPVRSGADCLLIAPTAGGKTEAAMFPVLSNMVDDGWRGLTVIYVTPLKALLNNLHPRLEIYAAWVGRRVGLWHGDIGDGERRRILADPPDVLLTTPESLEAMLVSRRVDHRSFFATVRAIIIDELHAFASADRGWHLLAVLERIQRLAGRRIQRIGLSATVGNPDEILTWMQGSNTQTGVDRQVVADRGGTASAPDVTLDYVGSVENAAEVLSRLYVGEKRLVFCQSRAQAEELAFELRQRRVTTFVSHSSLSVDERRQSERAFAEARDCVIVATSTLELGIDIGDLDRMVQIDAPFSVASFLQRLGRTGRRPGTVRNALFLATDLDNFLRAAGLLHLWSRGYVEPVLPPPHPRHIAAQQFLALALQEGRFPANGWHDWWSGCAVMDDADEVLDYLRNEQYLVEDGGFIFIGPAAERDFGRRHFMDLLSSFIADLELRVVAGVREIGSVSPLSMTRDVVDGRKPLLLAGRAWKVQSVTWQKHEVVVNEDPEKGKVRWASEPIAESFEMMRARREVLLGVDPAVKLSKRATVRLEDGRLLHAEHVDDGGQVMQRGGMGVRFWTWGGLRANQTLIAAMGLADSAAASNEGILLPFEIGVGDLRRADVLEAVPWLAADAVAGLKFSAALPGALAQQTLAERFADRAGALRIATDPVALVPNSRE